MISAVVTIAMVIIMYRDSEPVTGLVITGLVSLFNENSLIILLS